MNLIIENFEKFVFERIFQLLNVDKASAFRMTKSSSGKSGKNQFCQKIDFFKVLYIKKFLPEWNMSLHKEARD